MLIKTNFADFCKRFDANSQPVLDVLYQHVPPTYPESITTSLLGSLKKKESVEVFIGGGAVRRTLLKQPLDSDFDFFFNSEYTRTFVEENSTLKKTRETMHHTQFEGKMQVDGEERDVKIQNIFFQYYNSPEELIDSFDYTLCQFAVDLSGNLYTTPEALWDVARKRLAIHKITYPVSSLRRMLKYTNQGFTACSGCLQDFIQKSAALVDDNAMEIEYVD